MIFSDASFIGLYTKIIFKNQIDLPFYGEFIVLYWDPPVRDSFLSTKYTWKKGGKLD